MLDLTRLLTARSLVPITPERIDPDALKVVRRLQQFRYQAYVVGGGVRDLLLGSTPKDFDVATNATPNEIRRLFRNARIIGRRFRLAHLLFGRKVIETSTFRKNPRDGEVENGEAAEPAEPAESLPANNGEPQDDLLIRRDNVFGTAEEDATRRDFTINGLFYDPVENRIIDYVGGLEDLQAGIVRTIGDADIRMREDPIRILRAIRFAARLGLEIEPATRAALMSHRNDIARCAAPRILEDLYRLLRRGAAQSSLALLRETGVLEMLLPELCKAYETPTMVECHDRALFALDQRTAAAGAPPPNAVLLALLLLPLVYEFTDPDRPLPAGDPVISVDLAVRDVTGRLKMPRREVDRFRRIILAQRRMIGAPTRRFRPGVFARREEFADALWLLEGVAAWHRLDQGVVERWQHIAEGARLGHHDSAPLRDPRRGRGRHRRNPPLPVTVSS